MNFYIHDLSGNCWSRGIFIVMAIIKFRLSLLRVIWKCGQHFSTERIALAFSCVEFLKGKKNLSEVFGFRSASIVFRSENDSTKRVAAGRICICVRSESQSQRLQCPPPPHTHTSLLVHTPIFRSLPIQTCFWLFQQNGKVLLPYALNVDF
jgi:hypothetical protein